MRNSSKINITESTVDIVVGSWCDFFLAHFKLKSDINVSNIVAGNMVEFAQTRPDGIGLITLLSMKSSIPSRDARRVMADALAKTPITVAATIMEGLGFRAAAVRGFTSGLAMLAKQQYPYKFFRSVDESIGWIIEITKEKNTWPYLNSSNLSDAINSFVKKST